MKSPTAKTKPAKNARAKPATSAKTRRSAADAALPPWAPQCIYFYYLEPQDDQHADVRAFIYDQKRTLTDSMVDGLVPSFIEQAVNENYIDLTPVGHFFADVTWVRLSYVVVVVDAGHVLDHIHFRSSGHSLTHKTMLRDAGGAYGVRYRNTITRRNNWRWNRNKDEKETLRLESRFSRRLAAAAGDMRPMTHDDSGTNLGPPIGPP